MTRSIHHHRGTRRAVRIGWRTLAVASVALVLAAAPAYADTSAATANAATLEAVALPLVSTGTCSASNDSETETNTGPCDTVLSVAPFQTVLGAGALVQDARANTDGTSAACAGVVGAGGTILIGANGSCVASGQTSGLSLSLGLATLTSDAILARCTASSTGDPTGSTTLVNPVVTVGGLPVVVLPVNPAPNTAVINIPGIGSLLLNAQTENPDGSISVTAFDLQLLPAVGGGAHLTLGDITCGPNAVAPPIPAIPVAGYPIAVGTLVAGLIGGRWWLSRRRLVSGV